MPNDKLSESSVAVIGAGMTGITCARALSDAGFDVTVFEKSRGLGGRMATRRVGNTLTIDHGAQFFTARSAGFKAFLRRAQKSGSTDLWTPQTLDGHEASDDWFVGTPRMNAILKSETRGLDIRSRALVSSIVRRDNNWEISCGDKTDPETFGHVVCTTPVDQTRTLLASEPGIIDQMKDVTIAPCWALLMASEAKLRVGADVLRSPSDDIAWMARDNTKPGRHAKGDVWVVHASPAWSRENLEMPPDDAADAIRALVSDALDTKLREPTYVSAHRWRYAQTETPLGQPFIASDDHTLYVGGDWCLGARVEYAYQSGRAIADALINTGNT